MNPELANKQQNTHTMKLTKEVISAVLQALSRTTGATGEITKSKDGVVDASLTLTIPEDDDLLVSLSDFNGAYLGMVKCWPGIKPVKEQMLEQVRAGLIATKDAEKATKLAEKEAAKVAKAEAKAAAAKVKEDAKAAAAKAKEDAKAAKVAEAAKKAEDKKKADMAKAQAAADKKAEDDAKKAGATTAKPTPAPAKPTPVPAKPTPAKPTPTKAKK